MRKRRTAGLEIVMESRWLTTVAAALCLVIAAVAPVTDSTRVHYIHWNASNPIFRIDNTDHIYDVNAGNLPGEYDQANIICPSYKPGTDPDEAEQYMIYIVTKEEYDTCRIMDPQPRVIAQCNPPTMYPPMFFTITFRSFTPTPGGMEFFPGRDYYFISTSSKDEIDGRDGGRCRTHNMKMIFKVGTHSNKKGRRRPKQKTTTAATAVNVPRRRKQHGTTPRPPQRAPPREDVALLETNRLDQRKSRRGGRRRDLIKQEASRMHEKPATAPRENPVNLVHAGSGAAPAGRAAAAALQLCSASWLLLLLTK